MHTLLVDGTLLDNLLPVIKALGDESYIYAAIFYFFILLSALTVLNMLIGVLCEMVCAVAAMEKEANTVSFVREKMLEVMHKTGLDADGDGEISKAEFCRILEIPDACRCLQEVGVDVYGLVDIADFIFAQKTDSDSESDSDDDSKARHPHHSQNLTFEEFMEVVLQFRGSNSATVKDIVDLRKFITKNNSHIGHKFGKVLTSQKFRKRFSQDFGNDRGRHHPDRQHGPHEPESRVPNKHVVGRHLKSTPESSRSSSKEGEARLSAVSCSSLWSAASFEVTGPTSPGPPLLPLEAPFALPTDFLSRPSLPQTINRKPTIEIKPLRNSLSAEDAGKVPLNVSSAQAVISHVRSEHVHVLDNILQEFFQVELDKLIDCVAQSVDKWPNSKANAFSHAPGIPVPAQLGKPILGQTGTPEDGSLDLARTQEMGELQSQLVRFREAIGIGLPAVSAAREKLGLVELLRCYRSTYVMQGSPGICSFP